MGPLQAEGHGAPRSAALAPPSFSASSATLTNPYFPFAVGDELTYNSYGIEPAISCSWRAEGVEVIDGVSCLRMVWTRPGGQDRWWLAQADGQGDVYVLQTDGGFWGRANPLLLWPANVTVGTVLAPGSTRDEVVVATGISVSLATGSYTNIVKTRRDLGNGLFKYYYYAPGIGPIWQKWDAAGGTNGIQLTSIFRATTAVKGSLGGQVTDAITGRGVPGAALTLDPGGLNTVTNGDGLYSFASLASGHYSLNASKDGYEAASADGQVLHGQPTTLNIELEPATVTPATSSKGGGGGGGGGGCFISGVEPPSEGAVCWLFLAVCAGMVLLVAADRQDLGPRCRKTSPDDAKVPRYPVSPVANPKAAREKPGQARASHS